MKVQSPLLQEVQSLPALEDWKVMQRGLDSYPSRKLEPMGSAVG